jgi:hypothetical protein
LFERGEGHDRLALIEKSFVCEEGYHLFHLGKTIANYFRAFSDGEYQLTYIPYRELFSH